MTRAGSWSIWWRCLPTAGVHQRHRDVGLSGRGALGRWSRTRRAGPPPSTRSPQPIWTPSLRARAAARDVAWTQRAEVTEAVLPASLVAGQPLLDREGPPGAGHRRRCHRRHRAPRRGVRRGHVQAHLRLPAQVRYWSISNLRAFAQQGYITRCHSPTKPQRGYARPQPNGGGSPPSSPRHQPTSRTSVEAQLGARTHEGDRDKPVHSDERAGTPRQNDANGGLESAYCAADQHMHRVEHGPSAIEHRGDRPGARGRPRNRTTRPTAGNGPKQAHKLDPDVYPMRTRRRFCDHGLSPETTAGPEIRDLQRGAPGRIRTCAPASGGRCSIP